MTKFIDTISAIFGAIFGFLLGGLDGMLYALLAFIVLDYLSGCLVAISTKQLSSEIGFKGIFKKILIIALVGVANVVDAQVFGQGTALRTATIFFYLANEAISIIENASLLGLPIPKKLKAVLKQLNPEENSEETPDEEVKEEVNTQKP